MEQSTPPNWSRESKLCVSVFQNGEHTTTKEVYTKKWIVLINRMENRKCRST